MINYINKNLLDKVEKYSNSVLQKKTDLQLLVDECLQNDFELEFEELAFTGKYIEGLKRILQKGAEFSEIESLDYIKKDLTENMKKVVKQIGSIVFKATENTKNHFEETYLKLSPECLKNLNKLLADLERVKKYLNHQKYSA